VDPRILRQKSNQALSIGGLSFIVPLVCAGLFARFVAGWDLLVHCVSPIARRPLRVALTAVPSVKRL